MSAFADYSALKSAIAAWLINRTDLTAQIPWFISMAEASISRKLRTRQMINRSQVTAASRYIELPGDWRKAWNIQRVSDHYPLIYLTPVEMDKARYDLAKNPRPELKTATYYSLFGDSLEFLPSPATGDTVLIEMLYYTNIKPLSDGDPVNWLLLEHPDIYLYGSLVHTAPFLMEDERVEVWNNMFKEALAEANIEDADAKRSGAPLTKPNRSF